MIINELNDDNWLFFAIQNYNNPTSVTYDDFEEDLKRFKYIKRLLRRYEMHGELKTHLILNHIIVLYNTFNEQIVLKKLPSKTALLKMDVQVIDTILTRLCLAEKFEIQKYYLQQ